MNRREVVYAPEVEDDLAKLFDYIAVRSNDQTALDYISGIEAFCDGLDLASERGSLRNDLGRF